MTFEEILPRLKAWHTCFRASEHGLGLGSIKTSVNIRRVPETYGGDDAGTIGFLSISSQFNTGNTAAPGVGQSPRDTFSIWTPTVDDILATDWFDLDEIRVNAAAERAAKEPKESAPE